MPTLALPPLLITAGVVVLILPWPRMRSGPSGARLVAEVGVTAFVIFALLLGLLVAAQRIPW